MNAEELETLLASVAPIYGMTQALCDSIRKHVEALESMKTRADAIALAMEETNAELLKLQLRTHEIAFAKRN